MFGASGPSQDPRNCTPAAGLPGSSGDLKLSEIA